MSESEYYEYQAVIAVYESAIQRGRKPDEAASIAVSSAATPVVKPSA